MSLRLSPEDREEYSRRSLELRTEKEAAMARGDTKAARRCRQRSTALYGEFLQRQLLPEPEETESLAVHVICMNDSVEYAVVGDEDRALEKLEELRDAHYERNKGVYRTPEQHRAICFWHIHTVKGE